MSPDTTVLDCRNCGASLSIPPGLEQLACSFCSTVQVVRRAGGVTFLERQAAGIPDEMPRARTRIEPIADSPEAPGRGPLWFESRADRIRLERERASMLARLEHGRLGWLGWAVVTLVTTAVVAAFERANSRIGGLAVAGAVGVVLTIHLYGRVGVRKRIRAIDAQIAALADPA